MAAARSRGRATDQGISGPVPKDPGASGKSYAIAIPGSATMRILLTT